MVQADCSGGFHGRAWRAVERRFTPHGLEMGGGPTTMEVTSPVKKNVIKLARVSMIRTKLVIGIELALDPAHMGASCRACGRSRRERGALRNVTRIGIWVIQFSE
jgi:hypothetical protein